MLYIDNILFAIILIAGIGFFAQNVKKLKRNINLGRDVNRTDNSSARWKNMTMIALGQSKMVKRPIAAFLHLIVYVGFIIINLEVLEIIIDGLFGTHRVFSKMGSFYGFLIGSFEVLAVLVLVAVAAFWIRRNVLSIGRFRSTDLNGAPKKDANTILYFEVVLMSLFLIMNAFDLHFQDMNSGNIISQFLAPSPDTFSLEAVTIIERTAWWLHIVGILIFLNYLYYSKHLHILLAFPNTYFADLNAKGKFDNLESVTKEVKLMMDPNADPFAAQPVDENAVPSKFGASDVQDLNWVQLLNAYTCTECGRCTSSCPANQTGKKLSPRKIMMDTRDRMVELGDYKRKNGADTEDGKSLLGNYITEEELWACTSCNACVQECPVNIDPLSIIMDLRRFLVMEESKVPTELTGMLTNIENNGAPWQFAPTERMNWANED